VHSRNCRGYLYETNESSCIQGASRDLYNTALGLRTAGHLTETLEVFDTTRKTRIEYGAEESSCPNREEEVGRWTKFYGETIHNEYFSININKRIKSIRT
jgi:hypothetical protein